MCVFGSIMGEGNILDGHNSVYNECVRCAMGLLASICSVLSTSPRLQGMQIRFQHPPLYLQHVFSQSLFTLRCFFWTLRFFFYGGGINGFVVNYEYEVY